MKKKFLLVIAMIAMLVCLFAISVSAAECIDGIYYTFNGTEATVSSDNQKNCELETVVIPEKVTFGGTEYTVTAIAGKAFGSQNSNGGNSNIKSVTVPHTITSIGEYAFGNCPNITEAYCKSEKIGSRMFIDCSSLTTITFENTVEIGGNSFNRTLLTSVVIPSTVTTVGDYAFKECASLTKVVILGQIMGGYMFDGCSSLNTLVLTDEIKTFGDKCFGTKTYGTFTTYYTGSDYDRVKELGSYTSRFSKAECYSYSDYIDNGYTDTYMVIYDTNLCVAAFDGIHTEPKDDGDCTTPIICSFCYDYTYKEAMQHVNSGRLTYSNFMEEGEYFVGCTNDGCICGTTEKAEALFTGLGYSYSSMSTGAIMQGFQINKDAIEKYQTLSGKEIKYGILAASGNVANIYMGGFTNNVVSVDFTNRSYDIMEMKIYGIGEAHYATELYCCGYILVDGEIIYMDDGMAEGATIPSKVTYNSVANKAVVPATPETTVPNGDEEEVA